MSAFDKLLKGNTAVVAPPKSGSAFSRLSQPQQKAPVQSTPKATFTPPRGEPSKFQAPVGGVQIAPNKWKTPSGSTWEYEPDGTRVVRLAAQFGGGSYKVNPANPSQIVRSDRDYAGVPATGGNQRDHIIPVSLGGTSDSRTNIRSVPSQMNEGQFETDIANKVKSGEMSIGQARLAVMTRKQEQHSAEPKPTSFWDKVSNVVSNVTNAVSKFTNTDQKELDLINLQRRYSGKPEVQSTEQNFMESPIGKLLNQPKTQEYIKKVSDGSSDLGLKAYAGVQAIGPKTYNEAYNALLQGKNNPNNSAAKKFFYDLQSAGPQTLIGVLLNVAPTILTRGRDKGVIGTTLSGTYFGSLSAAEQLEQKGKITSPGNIAIDTIGDTILGNLISGLIKTPAKSILKEMIKNFGVEGGTEASQSILKYVNDYQNARTEKDRDNALARLTNYIKSGEIIREFAVGGIIGGGITAVAGLSGGNSTNIAVKDEDPIREYFKENPVEQPVEANPIEEFTIPVVKDRVVQTTDLNTGEDRVYYTIPEAEAEDIINRIDNSGGILPVDDRNRAYHVTAKSPEEMKSKGFKYGGVIDKNVIPKPIQEPKMKEIGRVKADIPKPEKPKSTKITSLEEEARKYKSAEEFVRAQTSKEYRIGHQINGGVSVNNIDLEALKKYHKERSGYLTNHDLKDLNRLQKLQGVSPDTEVTIYRASPKNELNSGDWVTMDKVYANDIKNQNGGKVFSHKVKIGDLVFPKNLDELPSSSRFSAFRYESSTTKSQLTDIWNKANKPKKARTTVKEIKTEPKATPEIKTSKLSERVEAKAIEAGLTRGFEDKPEYAKVNKKDQAEAALRLLEENPEYAYEIALGNMFPPEGLLPESVFVAVLNRAIETNDVQTLEDLATSNLASEATGMGQRISMLSEVDPYSPVKGYRKYKERLVKKAGGEEKVKEKTKKIVKTIKEETSKNNLSKEDLKWDNFLEGIKC